MCKIYQTLQQTSFCIILCLFLSYSNAGFAQEKVKGPEDQKNWISIYIWDSFAPLTLDKTVAEMLVSLEVIFQQHATYTTKKIAKSPYGNRSTEGHFMVWLHLDESFFERYKLNRKDFDERIYMFKDRENDIFTAWCGQANFRDFILDGVSGLTSKTVLDDGTVSGDLDVFSNAVNQGNAEYGAGYYISDEQALNALKAIMKYPGHEKGYGFIAKKNYRPEQEGYEHSNVQGVNGYNCNDFAFYMLENSGVMTKQQTENLKVEFWYPEYYWDHTIPLRGSGKRIYKKFEKDRNLYMTRGRILQLAWSEFLFSGLDIFDEETLMKDIRTEPAQMKYNKVRLWDQMTMINYLKNPSNRDFKSKLVIEELKYAVDNNLKISTPYQEAEQIYNYRTTKSYTKYKKGSEKRTQKKLKKVGLKGKGLSDFQDLEKSLKD
ncbi:MAG: hypothetical protein GY810_27005 [Aureispira sp.]|nr:hypothetical protein [Aureispira sp.]